MDYLKLACDRLGVEPGKVMAHKVYDDHIALVVDNGRLGCPKYTIPLAELQPPKPVTLPESVEPEVIPEPPERTPRRRAKR